jgi:MoaA/NifB/PqqE/SkfB family radical SAM enzyme
MIQNEKLLGFAGTALKSNFVKLDRPYKLNFCITYWCQSRCLTCNIWQMKPKGELSIDEIREFVKKNPYFKWVELTGGEPFLRSDIVEIAKAFKEYSKGLYIITMPTNSLCDHGLVERKLREILSLGIPRVAITVSLDGYKELHDKIRGIPGNYEKAIDTFKRLKQLKKEFKNLYFVFGYTLSKLNKGEFEKTYEAVKIDIPDITYNDFHINLAQVSGNYYNNADDDIKVNNPEIVNELKSALQNRKSEVGIIPIVETAFMKRLIEYAKTGVSPMIPINNVGQEGRQHKGGRLRPLAIVEQRYCEERQGRHSKWQGAKPVDCLRGLSDTHGKHTKPLHLIPNTHIQIIMPIKK